MSDGLVEALREAGVASEAALEAQVTTELSLVDHEPEQVWKSEGIIAAIAADAPRVLRVLLEARLREIDAKTNDDGEIIVNVIVDGVPTREWAATKDLLSLLAPEGTRGN